MEVEHELYAMYLRALCKFDHCQGEMDEPCFNCDDCIHWDGKTGREMWRDECSKYKITEYWAAHLRRKMKII